MYDVWSVSLDQKNRTTRNREISGEEKFNVLYFLCILHLLENHQPTQLLIVSHRPTYLKNKPCLSFQKNAVSKYQFFSQREKTTFHLFSTLKTKIERKRRPHFCKEKMPKKVASLATLRTTKTTVVSLKIANLHSHYYSIILLVFSPLENSS